MSNEKRKRWSPTQINFWFDLLIFVAALFAPAVMFTGLAIHEWLGLGLGLAVIAHLLLHWQWIAQITRRFFARTTGSARLNYVVNVFFFIDLTVIVASGIMISRVALPFFGVELQTGGSMWRPLHTLAADAMVLILATHVALHGKWIVATANRLLLQPVLRLGQRSSQPAGVKVLEKGGAA